MSKTQQGEEEMRSTRNASCAVVTSTTVLAGEETRPFILASVRTGHAATGQRTRDVTAIKPGDTIPPIV